MPPTFAGSSFLLGSFAITYSRPDAEFSLPCHSIDETHTIDSLRAGQNQYIQQPSKAAVRREVARGRNQLRTWEVLLACTSITIATACGGGGGSGSGSGGGGSLPPPKDGAAAIADVDIDNDGLIEISTVEELDWIRNDLLGTSLRDHKGQVNSGGCPVDGCHGYELASDLNFDTNGDGVMDARDTYFDYDHNGSNAGWLPIPDLAATFEGNGHRILNLYINRPDREYVGLIAAVDAGGRGGRISIGHIELAGPLTSIVGSDSVGALAGGVNVVGQIDIYSDKAAGKVEGRRFNVGGLIGNVSIDGGQLTFQDNQSSATVSAAEIGTGGLIGNVLENAGMPGGSVKIARNTSSSNATSPSFSGGIVGVLYGNVTMEDCSATGKIEGGNAGGLIGVVSGHVTVRRSSSSGDVISNAQGQGSAGGLIGSVETGQISISDVNATPTLVSGNEAGGLIGRVLLNSGTLDLHNASVQAAVIGNSPSVQNVGGLIGEVKTYSDAQLTVSTSFATGAANGLAAIGGLFGFLGTEGTSHVTISNVFSLVSAKAQDSFEGGVVGHAIARDASSIVLRNGYVLGQVFATNTGLPFIGALAGAASADLSSTANMTFENSYWATDTSGLSYAFGSMSGQTVANDVVGATLDNLSCPSHANDSSCWSFELYHLWDQALNDAQEPAWQFEGPGKLPALSFGGAAYRPVVQPEGGFIVVKL